MPELPYLSEHEPVEKESKKDREDVYQPTPEERKTLKLVNKLFEKAKKHRSKFDNKWADYYKMFRGKQWKDQRPSYRSSEVINMVFQTIQGQVPILTDNRPKFEFIPENPSDIPLQQILNEINDWDWTRKNWIQVVTELLFDGHFFGTGLTQLEIDPKGEMGLGSIELNTLDPFYCFPDPNAPSPNHPKSRSFITAVPTDVDVIKGLYKEKGKYVKPDLSGFEILDRSQNREMKYTSPVDNVILTDESPTTYSQQDKAILMTVFFKDDDYEEVEEKRVNPQTGQEDPIYIQKLKYPNGRIIQVASGVVLKDEELPIEEGFFPIQKYVNYIDPREFWGISEVEQLESPQKLFNKVLSFAMDVLNLTGNPVWIVDTTAEIDTDNLINKPGLVVEKAPGSEVRRESGVQLQPFVMNLLEMFREWHDGVSGYHDVSRGVNPTGVTAARAISELMQAGQTRLRQKSRNLDAYLQELGQHYLKMIFQFYTIPRIVRITDQNNPEIYKYFKFQIAQEEGSDKKQVRIREYQQNEQGQLLPGEEQEHTINGSFDIKVVTGSSLPFSKVEKENKLFALYDRKIIDAEEVLKGLEYPNYESILQRQQQLAAQQMPPQPGM